MKLWQVRSFGQESNASVEFAGARLSSRSDRRYVCWRAIAILCVLLAAGPALEGQITEIDKRKVDEIILLDISGSMVRDIRTALLKKGFARGETDNDGFYLARGVKIEEALARTELQSVVTNNLLYKTILCVEAIIDQPGVRTIYVATFDRGLRSLVAEKSPAQLGDGLYGPFIIGETDVDVNSPGRLRIKSFLAPDRHGSYGGSLWRGILAESILKGSGPTALYQTGDFSLNFLEKLVKPGYANATRQQRMFLFTDGQEEMDRQIPFSRTVEHLGRHFNFLNRNGVGFEFTKYYIGDGAPIDPVPNKPAWLGQVVVPPRTFRVAAGLDKALVGEVRLPRVPGESATVVLLPSIRFRVTSDDQKPVSGRLLMKVSGQETISGLNVQVTPSHVMASGNEQLMDISLVLQGSFLNGMARSGLKSFEKLLLGWELWLPPERSGNPESRVEFYGDKRWPISLRIIPPVEEVVLRCIEPAGQDLSSGKPLDLQAVPRMGTLATFEADFSKIDEGGSLLVELKSKPESSWVKLNSGSEGKVILAKNANGSAKPAFSLTAEAPPGAGRAEITLNIIPQSQWLTPAPSNIEVAVMFEPSIIGTAWFTHDDQPAVAPMAIDLGTNDMEPILNGDVRPSQPPPVDTVKLVIPDSAVAPAARWVLTGDHPEAFAVICLGDGGGAQPQEINRSVKLQVRAKHFFVENERWTTTNLTAVLEIQPATNFIFAPHEAATTAQRTSKIEVPLRMTAVIPPRTENLKPSN